MICDSGLSKQKCHTFICILEALYVRELELFINTQLKDYHKSRKLAQNIDLVCSLLYIIVNVILFLIHSDDICVYSTYYRFAVDDRKEKKKVQHYFSFHE